MSYIKYLKTISSLELGETECRKRELKKSKTKEGLSTISKLPLKDWPYVGPNYFEIKNNIKERENRLECKDTYLFYSEYFVNLCQTKGWNIEDITLNPAINKLKYSGILYWKGFKLTSSFLRGNTLYYEDPFTLPEGVTVVGVKLLNIGYTNYEIENIRLMISNPLDRYFVVALLSNGCCLVRAPDEGVFHKEGSLMLHIVDCYSMNLDKVRGLLMSTFFSKLGNKILSKHILITIIVSIILVTIITSISLFISNSIRSGDIGISFVSFVVLIYSFVSFVVPMMDILSRDVELDPFIKKMYRSRKKNISLFKNINNNEI